MCVERLYTFTEAARLLNVSESTLRKKVAAGRMPHRKVFRHVRFSAADLEATQIAFAPLVGARGTGRRRTRAGGPAST